MYINGATLQGAAYGGLSPLDFSGLEGWWRTDAGVQLQSGASISRWNDLSGNDRTLVGVYTNNEDSTRNFGIVRNTPYGLGMGGGDGNGCLAVTSDKEFQRILFNGSKMSVFIVYRVNLLSSNTGFRFIGTGSQSQSQMEGGYLSIICPTGNQAVRSFSFSSTIANNDISGLYQSPANYILTLEDLGYVPETPLLHRRMFINNELRNQVKFSGAPSNNIPSQSLRVQYGGISGNTPYNFLYEILIYNHTGKSSEQIKTERERLYNEYLLPRYPNFLS